MIIPCWIAWLVKLSYVSREKNYQMIQLNEKDSINGYKIYYKYFFSHQNYHYRFIYWKTTSTRGQTI